ncbi:M56 family metallopeptidase [Anoxybacteroides tepidamans]|uniref:M56 family metallopeptidase n=1 Tax=Anoxybacteroides tepidamans TaxID=265948 RepID=UPI00048060FB|nr:M56 family metallopeptidase [Anoxybacillus tepidamans]
MSLKNKSRAALIVIFLFGAFTLAEMAIFLFHHLHRIIRDWFIPDHFMAVDGGIFVLGTVISAFFIFVFVKTVWLIAKQIRLSSKWYTTFLLLKDEISTESLNVKYPEFNNRILVIESSEFIALTIGFIKPKIVISTFVAKRFSDEELRAILLHEQFHLLHRDPLKLMLVKIVSDQVGYVPLLKRLAQYYNISRELLADGYAMRRGKNNTAIGAVLLKVAKMGEGGSFSEGAAHFAQSSINYRILQMIDPNKSISIPIVTKKSFVLSVVLLLINFYAFAACFADQTFCHKFLM